MDSPLTPTCSSSPPPYAWVKRGGDPSFHCDTFTPVSLEGHHAVGFLAEFLASKFKGWGVEAYQVGLYLVAPGGDLAPSLESINAVLGDESKRLGEGLSLAAAGVTPGSWLVARVPPPPFVGGGAGGDAASHTSGMLATLLSAVNENSKAMAELKRKSDLAALERLFVRPVHSTGTSSITRSPREDERPGLKQCVIDEYGMNDPNDPTRCFTHMGGPSVQQKDATMAHIWPSSESGSAGLLAGDLKLPYDFHIQPWNILLLPENVHRAFDNGWLLLLPVKAPEDDRGGGGGSSLPSRVMLRTLHVDAVTVGGDPGSDASLQKRAWLRSLDGTFLAFRNDLRPFMRLLGWRAWTMRVAPSNGGVNGVEWKWEGGEEEEEGRSVDAEGNKALKALVRKGKLLLAAAPS